MTTYLRKVTQYLPAVAGVYIGLNVLKYSKNQLDNLNKMMGGGNR